MKSNIIYLFLYFVSFLNSYSQTPYEDTQHYQLDTEDSFNSFNANLWNITPNNHWGLETYSSNNVTAVNGVLELRCEKIDTDPNVWFPTINGNYLSGGIETVNKKDFSYGYLEIESQFPTDGNGNKMLGPWGGFWMHGGGPGIWNEIDMLEPNGCDTEFGNMFNSGISSTNSGVHVWKPNAHYIGYHTDEASVDPLNPDIFFPDLSTNFNKYALIWTPKYAKVLFNGFRVYEELDSKYIPNGTMSLFLTFQIDAWGCKPDENIPFPPMYWKFKNFKYYVLKTDCENGINASSFQFDPHDYKVQKYYRLYNSSVPNNANVYLRATDYVELINFTVPQGSTFTVITHHGVCPN